MNKSFTSFFQMAVDCFPAGTDSALLRVRSFCSCDLFRFDEAARRARVKDEHKGLKVVIDHFLVKHLSFYLFPTPLLLLQASYLSS